jgi:CRP-like cAMP-binding protein
MGMAAIDCSLAANLPLFACLAAAELDAILQEARPVRHPKNSAVFEQGEEAHAFFLLLHGHVRAAKTTSGGQQIVLRYARPGEIFGVAVAIGLRHYPATATAVDDSDMLAWPSAAWPRLVERHPHPRCPRVRMRCRRAPSNLGFRVVREPGSWMTRLARLVVRRQQWPRVTGLPQTRTTAHSPAKSLGGPVGYHSIALEAGVVFEQHVSKKTILRSFCACAT